MIWQGILELSAAKLPVHEITEREGLKRPHPLRICSKLTVARRKRDIFSSGVYPGKLPIL